MTKNYLAIFLVLLLTLLGVLADAVLKHASSERNVLVSGWLITGIALSCAFAVGWMLLMRVMKLASAGALYGVGSAVLLCLIGVIFFEEKLSSTEVAGIGAAVVAIALLSGATK